VRSAEEQTVVACAAALEHTRDAQALAGFRAVNESPQSAFRLRGVAAEMTEFSSVNQFVPARATRVSRSGGFIEAHHMSARPSDGAAWPSAVAR
jgi:hypothetical protein